MRLPAASGGAALAIVCFGCSAWVEQTPLNDAPAPMQPRSPDTVEVFSSGAPLRPHVDVALLHVEGCMACTREDRLEQLREVAARTGCDALFIVSLSARDPTGTCIVYSDGTGTMDDAAEPRAQTQHERCERYDGAGAGVRNAACFGSLGM